MTDLVLRAPDDVVLAEEAPAGERARSYARSAIAANTRRSYESQWRAFVEWCRGAGRDPLPATPAAVCDYLAALADLGRKAATIDQALAAIGKAHRLAGYPSPRSEEAVRLTRKGIRNEIGVAQKGKAPLLGKALRSELAGERPRGRELAALRDHALLLVGWHGALRRSELVALDVGDLRVVPEGLELKIQRCKTDQEGKGRVLPIPRAHVPELCPERVVRAWLAAATITEGAVFRRVDRWGHVGGRLSGAAVGKVVKRVAELAGLDAREYGGHSLRSGLVTQAARAGKDVASIMKLTGHASVAMVQRYIREAGLWQDVASRGLLEGA